MSASLNKFWLKNQKSCLQYVLYTILEKKILKKCANRSFSLKSIIKTIHFAHLGILFIYAVLAHKDGQSFDILTFCYFLLLQQSPPPPPPPDLDGIVYIYILYNANFRHIYYQHLKFEAAGDIDQTDQSTEHTTRKLQSLPTCRHVEPNESQAV